MRVKLRKEQRGLCWPRILISPLQFPQYALQVCICLTPSVPTPERGKATSAVWLCPISTSTHLHTQPQNFSLLRNLSSVCVAPRGKQLALSPLPHHRPETGWMKLLSSPSFQICGAIVMVLPPIWDLQLLCPCCICRGHLQRCSSACMTMRDGWHGYTITVLIPSRYCVTLGCYIA